MLAPELAKHHIDMLGVIEEKNRWESKHRGVELVK